MNSIKFSLASRYGYDVQHCEHRIRDFKSSSSDLQEMFAYSSITMQKKVVLIYPATETSLMTGSFCKHAIRPPTLAETIFSKKRPKWIKFLLNLKIHAF